MLVVERQRRIIEKLQIEKKVLVSELSQTFKVSEETIRRDLDKLEKEGLIVKSYGGAILNENDNIELPFNIRKKQNIKGKQIIADLAVEIVEEGDHIMLDASSTAVYMAKKLKSKSNLTVVTNSIEVMIELSDMPGWHVICTGGTLENDYLALAGQKTIDGFSSYQVEKTFFSCKGIDLQKGIMDGNEGIARIKSQMCQSAQKSILVIDSTKFGHYAFSKIDDFSNIDIVITDIKPELKWLTFFEQMRIKCIFPDK